MNNSEERDYQEEQFNAELMREADAADDATSWPDQLDEIDDDADGWEL
jgi:hypothetical protein